MRIDRRNGADERTVLAGMITDATVLSHVAKVWHHDIFRSQFAALVGGWCVDYHRQYGEAPGRRIESIFESWASQEDRDETTVKLINRLLITASDEHRRQNQNSQYVIDLAGRHFSAVRASRLSELIRGDLDRGDLDQAYTRISECKRVELGNGSICDVLQDAEALQIAFEDSQEPLMRYPGALGQFFDQALERDAFVGFMGPEKRGKTWWLLDLAWRAMLQRRQVAFFEVGDMSQNQVLRRFGVRAARKPLRDREVSIPISIGRESKDSNASVELETYDFDGLTYPEVLDAIERTHAKLRTDRTLLRLSCHPNLSISADGILATLQEWERDGWVPDVVVVDYADDLAPPTGVKEGRDRINVTWQRLRAISQQFHCLLVTATQSDAKSYDAKTIRRQNFSDDKRKLAHVTGMIGLNSSDPEKSRGIYRLNWIVLREADYQEGRCVHVAGCLPLGNPAVLSCW